MSCHQKRIQLPAMSRGFHLITHYVERALDDWQKIECGVAHIFIQHSSASLTINENADSTVRSDLNAYLDKFVPENEPYFRHTYEGADDMPAHIKASLLGSSVSIPIANNRLLLGTWQGIYLGEHRNHGGERSVVITIQS